MMNRTQCLTLVAVLGLVGCQSTTAGSDEHVLATIPGTWRAAALGGEISLNLAQGPVNDATHSAPITGSGSSSSGSFSVGGSLSAQAGNGQQLNNVVLSWTMPYLHVSNRQFQFGGGLEEVTASGSRMVGFITAPGRDYSCPSAPPQCTDPDINISVTFIKSQ